jgi:hypothetical protein
MGRKIRTAKRRQEVPLLPAATYALMVGQWAPVRLAGWVKLAQAGQCGEPTLDEVWEAHGDALINEAATFGFEPYRLTRRRPGGPGFSRWQQDFFDLHQY